MKRLFFASLFFAACAAPALAQNGDYNKYDFYVGYSHNRADVGAGDDDIDPDDIFDEREGLHGFEVAVKGNVRRYVGIKFDYTFHRRGFDVNGFDVNVNAHTFLGGVQFNDNARGRGVKPFAHVLAGASRVKAEIDGVSDFDGDSDTGFSAVVGGGIDFRINDRVDFRAIQFDYNPTRFEGQTQHNFRIGLGIVFR